MTDTGQIGGAVFKISAFRRVVVWSGVALLVLLLTGRLLWIQILHPDTLIKEGNARVVRSYHSEPPRGCITDRFGRILALSVPVKNVAADPQTLHETGVAGRPDILARMAQILEMPPEELAAKIADPQKRFVHLRHYLALDRAAELEKLVKKGLMLNDSYRRYYPTGEVNAGLIGILNGEGEGVYGVEQSFNSYLTAESSTVVARKDRYDRVIENVGTVREGSAGGNLMLSIDSRLQLAAYQTLADAVRAHKAESGSAVLVDVRSGEILSMVNYPSFDPNDRSRFDGAHARNMTITDTFEPGSTLKPFVALSALEHQAIRWGDVIDTRPYVVDGKTVRDSHYMASGSLRDIIKYSSNTGMARLSQRLGPQKVMETLTAFGFGQRTMVGLVGESAGRLNEHRRFWSEIDKATLGFGYGMTVTCLQLTAAYAALANDGMKLPVSILRQRTQPEAQRVVSRAEDQRMQAAMESVVSEGTGKQAAISRYRVAGKTGTAKIAGRGGYSDSYMSTFVGFAPLSAPRFALAVVVRNPQIGGYYGGTVSGPVFSAVMGRALQLYNVPPDRPDRPAAQAVH